MCLVTAVRLYCLITVFVLLILTIIIYCYTNSFADLRQGPGKMLLGSILEKTWNSFVAK